MAGLSGVNKHGRGAGRCQRGGDLAADVAALAHAHHNHPATAGQHDLHGARKLGPNAAGKPQHGCGFYLNGLACKGLCLLCIEMGNVKTHPRIL